MPASQEPHTNADVPVWQVRLDNMLPAVAYTAAQAESVLRRRQLLRRGFWAGVAVLTAGSLAAASDFLLPHDVRRFGNRTVVAARDVPKPGDLPYHQLEGRFWLVNLKPGEGVPATFQYRIGVGESSQSGGLLALYDKCTHLGSTVPWRDDFVFGGVTGWFRCPSHGATFTKAGLRVFGPAPRAMDTFAITGVSAAGVTVNTGWMHLGGTDDAQRTVPAGPFSK